MARATPRPASPAAWRRRAASRSARAKGPMSPSPMPLRRPVSDVMGRAARLVGALASAPDKREWFADKLAWRRFWQRLPDEHRRNLAFDARYGLSTAAEVPLAD